MSSRSRTTELRVLAGAVGVGALVAAVAGIRHRRSTRGLTLSSDVEPNALLKTPTLKADISELTTDDGGDHQCPGLRSPSTAIRSFSVTAGRAPPNSGTRRSMRLPANNRVITYDQRGHGRSTVGNLPLGPDVLADDLSAVLAATVREDKKAVIVGHSMGGNEHHRLGGSSPRRGQEVRVGGHAREHRERKG